MKIGQIVKTNQKGQIVIPKEMRKALGIAADIPLNMTLRSGGIYLFPVSEVMTQGEKESSYFSLLKKTQGAWAGDNWPAAKKSRKKIEISASAKRKQGW